MKKPKNKELKIEIAPKDKIRFNQMVIDFFIVKILGVESFLVTDESRISDLLTKPWGEKAKPLGDNKFLVTTTYFESGRALKETGKHFLQLSKTEREKYKVVKEDIYKKEDLFWAKDLVFETWNFFGVHLDEKFFKGNLVDLGTELSSQLSEEKQSELIGSYPSLFPYDDNSSDEE